MWAIRFILLGALGAMVWIAWVLLRRRSRYEGLLESGPFNYAFVIVYNVLSWLIMVLPPAGGWDCRPDWMEYPVIRIGFGVIGLELICAGFALSFATARKRKALGAQDAKEGLITTGVYRYFRHPIYTGILCVCLGLGLVTRNPDGLLFFPALFVINLVQANSEERNDMILRFPEQYLSYTRKVRMFGPIWLWTVVSGINLLLVVAILFILIISGCSTTPRLTAEDRKSDIQFLAQWAKDYSPLVELNEKHKGTPSYEALLPKYLEFAEQAQSNEDFYQVVWGYLRVIGASGHAYLLPDNSLKWASVGSLLGICQFGITPRQFQQARYWPKLAGNLSTRAHPPFRVEGREGKYFTGDDWQYDGTTIPKGSEILKVNGMTCSRYLEYIKENTSLKYDAYPKGWADYFVMIVDEGPSFKGWQVDFGLPDGNVLAAFVPKVKGFPASKEEEVHTAEPKANCTCLELADDIGYIRIRSFVGSPLDFLFKKFIKEDRKKIKAFLERSRGKYNKLIIDVRNNSGGDPAYFYDNLIRPFLDQPVTYGHTVGLKRRFLKDTKPSVLRQLRKALVPKYVTDIKEVIPPEGFDNKEWIFYEIMRRLEPTKPYTFNGEVFVLINAGCFSACDDYSNTIKRIGIATLAGQTTGGAGGIGYCMTPFVRLPQSGTVFALDIHLPLNPDGSFTALHGLEPDIEFPDADPPKSITKQDLLKDEWIKSILTK